MGTNGESNVDKKGIKYFGSTIFGVFSGNDFEGNAARERRSVFETGR